MDVLVELGADINARDITACTPLQNAAHGTYSALAAMPASQQPGTSVLACKLRTCRIVLCGVLTHYEKALVSWQYILPLWQGRIYGTEVELRAIAPALPEQDAKSLQEVQQGPLGGLQQGLSWHLPAALASVGHLLQAKGGSPLRKQPLS